MTAATRLETKPPADAASDRNVLAAYRDQLLRELAEVERQLQAGVTRR